MTETWKSVVGWETHYEVSDAGRVRRIGGQVMVGGLGSKGYRIVTLCRDGSGKTFNVHSLVAGAFIGTRPDGLQINHKDGNPLNNAADNLEYVTAAQNSAHAVEHGLRPEGDRHWTRRKPDAVRRGEANGNARLTPEKVVLAREMRAAGAPLALIGKCIGVSDVCVSNILRGRTWRHVA